MMQDKVVLVVGGATGAGGATFETVVGTVAVSDLEE